MLPDELMGDSSLLAHMNGVCASTGGSVVALKEVPHEEVGALRRDRPGRRRRRRRRRADRATWSRSRPSTRRRAT